MQMVEYIIWFLVSATKEYIGLWACIEELLLQ